MRISRGALLGLVTFVASCATGGGTEPPDAGQQDAARDAGLPQDQQTFDGPTDTLPQDMQTLPSDAPAGSNLFCANNAACTIVGECCFDFVGQINPGICIEGTTPLAPIDDTCVPPL